MGDCLDFCEIKEFSQKMVSGVRFQRAGVRFQETGVRCQVSGRRRKRCDGEGKSSVNTVIQGGSRSIAGAAHPLGVE